MANQEALCGDSPAKPKYINTGMRLSCVFFKTLQLKDRDKTLHISISLKRTRSLYNFQCYIPI